MYMYQNQNCGCEKEKRRAAEKPQIVNLDRAVCSNQNFRTVLWTGEYLQVTLMCIPVGGDIGFEIHKDTDQLIRLEQGCAMVRFGEKEDSVSDVRRITCHDAVLIPAGTWHNIVNCGNVPLKLFSVYAPPHHPAGAVQRTQEKPERKCCDK